MHISCVQEGRVQGVVTAAGEVSTTVEISGNISAVEKRRSWWTDVNLNMVPEYIKVCLT